jgi:hypothetical protein
VGVQSFDTARGKLLVFAVNTWKRWSSASTDEFDIYVDINGDGVADFLVVGIVYGYLTAGRFDGRMASAVINLATGSARVRFLATAPTDGSTLLLPLYAADMGISAARPAFSYTAESSGERGSGALPGRASLNAFNSSISQGQDVVVAPDNKSGPAQARLLPVTNQAEAAPAPRPCRWGRGRRPARGRTRRPPRGWRPRARAARAA